MKISNVRMGLATNSSSSHSLVLFPNLKQFKNNDEGTYGWEDFLLTDRTEKENYLAVTLFKNLSSYKTGLTEEYAALITNGLIGRNYIIKNNGDEHYPYNYDIDHQSLISLPKIHGVDQINFQFFNDLRDYILNTEGLGIAGGNDNDERMDYGGKRINKTDSITDLRAGSLICKKDGDWWILFNKENGTKIRLSFNDNAKEYTSSKYPELVDVKITNFCPYGCEYCYQNSTLQGKHSTKVKEILNLLSAMEVFEVAFGGGETTMHPDFAEILEYCNSVGIIPNFTTFNTKWTNNKEINDAVIKYVGGFALSVNDFSDLNKIDKVGQWIKANREYHYNKFPEVSIQCIIGLCDNYMIKNIITTMKKNNLNRLTLLGFKSFGRSEDSIIPKKVQLKEIFKLAKENYISIGMDTKSVLDYEEEIDKENISKILRTNEEGKFSMYIDAVESFISKDSYSKDKINFDIDSLEDIINKNYPF